MTKSTKRPLPVSKTIQFQQHQKIKDISVSGKDALTSVDFSERDGDFKLKVKADPDKVNEVSGTPFVTTSVTTSDEGTDDPKKSVALGHDYRGLNLETAGKYLSINKTKDKAVIDGTLIEADLTKALNDAKEAKDKADKAAEKAGLADQKATTAISQIADVKDALAKLQEASEGADKLLKTDIANIREILAKLPKDAKLYVNEESRDIAKHHNGRVEGLKRVELYTDLDNSNAVSLSVSDNVTLTIALKQNDNSIDSLDFSREVAEIRLEVAKPDLSALTASVEDAKQKAEDAKVKSQDAQTKAEDAKAKAEQANAKADDLAKKLEDAKSKEISDIASVTDAVTKLGEASKTADGELKKAIDALAEKLKNANTTNSAEPLKVTDESKRAIMQARTRQTGLESVDFVVGGETVTVTYSQENVNKTGYEDASTHDFSHGLKTSQLGGLNGGTGLFVSLKYDAENRVLTNIVTDIHFASYEKNFATDLIKIRDWLKFPPLTPAKALLQLSQAKGRTNFTQDDLDSGVIVSGGLLVDMGEYWLPAHVSVAGTSVTFSGNKADAQALLDFNIKTYNVDTAEVETIKASELLEPGTKCPPILKTVY
ncbi:MAG: hypothetical protein [Bacteriophage sp.]|nr:MAG: hypothetical protein [Bacteriophage sp.]